jgi:hypothetical protein
MRVLNDVFASASVSEFARRNWAALLVFPSDQTFRKGALRASVVKRPGVSTLAAGKERYAVPGGGGITVPIMTSDRLRVVHLEGRQPCEPIAADAAESLTLPFFGARGDGGASGLKRILSEDNESARIVLPHRYDRLCRHCLAGRELHRCNDLEVPYFDLTLSAQVKTREPLGEAL